LAVALAVADRGEELLQLGDGLYRIIGLHGRFARTDRSCEDIEGHPVGSGLAGVDLSQSFRFVHGERIEPGRNRH
jgi:hypothetical protein